MCKSKIKKSRFVMFCGILGASFILSSCTQHFDTSNMQLDPENKINSGEKMSTIKMHQIDCNSLYEGNGICNCNPIEVSVYDELYAKSTQWLKKSYTKSYPERPGFITGAMSYIEGSNFIHTRVEAVVKQNPSCRATIQSIEEPNPDLFVKNFCFSNFYLLDDASKRCSSLEPPYGLFTERDRLHVSVTKVSERSILAAIKYYFPRIYSNNNKNLNQPSTYEEEIRLEDSRRIIEEGLKRSTMMHGFNLNSANLKTQNILITLEHNRYTNLFIKLDEYMGTMFTFTTDRVYFRSNNQNVKFWYDVSNDKFICTEEDLSKIQKLYEERRMLTIDPRLISLHFMLHLNEDFDDDLLADAIDLLHG